VGYDAYEKPKYYPREEVFSEAIFAQKNPDNEGRNFSLSGYRVI